MDKGDTENNKKKQKVVKFLLWLWRIILLTSLDSGQMKNEGFRWISHPLPFQKNLESKDELCFWRLWDAFI